MPSLAGVQALIFDTFGTLVDWRSGVVQASSAFLARHAPGAEGTVFADAWRGRYQPAMDEVRSGRRPFVRLDVLHRESLEAILPSVGVDPARIAPAELEALTLAWHRLDPWPDSVTGLARLKTRFTVAPHSNGNIRLLIDLARHCGLTWDWIAGAEVAQAYKPAPESYLRVADILGLRPAEICMVAAHNYDLAAARECGMATAFICRPQEHGPTQSTDLHPTQEWDVIASDMHDLASQLGT